MQRFATFFAVFSMLLTGAVPLPAYAQQTKKKSSSSSTTKSKAKATPAKKSTPKKTASKASAPPALPADGSVPTVHAKAYVVIDAKSGEVLTGRSEHTPRPPASTQKLLTALIIAESGGLDEPLRVEVSDTWAEPTKLYLKAGDVYTRRQLLEVLLVRSMNDVAVALARDNAGSVEGFAQKMNDRARRAGARNSYFVNPNGLPAPGQQSTAWDMSRIAMAAYANPTIRSMVAKKKITFRYADGKTREFTNTNRVMRNYAICNGMKTGYTNAAGFCLVASGQQNGRDVITVVLGNTKANIWRDSYLLLAWGLSS